MIVEPIMMNAGIITPDPGYLAGLAGLLHAHGALLTFDEVKTGLTAGPSGATGVVGVTPDILCLAKAIGGGVASACGGRVGRGHGPRGRGRVRDGGDLQREPPGHGGHPGHAHPTWPRPTPTDASTASGTGP